MPPFPIHGVPDEELYTGQDGVQRPYGMQFGPDSPLAGRSRRTVAETGSFGKSTRRSRSKSGTPAVKKEDPTLAAADKIFPAYFAAQEQKRDSNPSRKTKFPASTSQPNVSNSGILTITDGNGETTQRYVHKEPTEVILRGFSHQYAAISHYERVAGMICEDYSRDPPIEQRKYKGDQRDPTVLRPRKLTVEERAKAQQYKGGKHWIKVTYESAEAAERAIENSPQVVLGHFVHAEIYRGVPPINDEALLVNGGESTPGGHITRGFGSMGRSQTAPESLSWSPPTSITSSQTLDTGTISHGRSSSATPAAAAAAYSGNQNTYCRRIPTAKRIQLLPAEQALLPQQSYSQRLFASIPILGWISSDVIGSQIPKTEQGTFDHVNASFYWRWMWWLDTITGWLDLAPEKEE
ncbi:hypothetical protein BJ878DRAFT_513275 [Calycina marina]|uniref:Nucleoporin NUP53 n=1 Tax=Calycina marina TaxID=1763456 RepID=A0A9P8CDR0_9HELO|nr:hypothetical protein BJ878DRAFT_513275 [Calycina marina]